MSGKHSRSVILFVLLVAGMMVIPTVSAGTLFSKSSVATSPTGKMIVTQWNLFPYSLPGWNNRINISGTDTGPAIPATSNGCGYPSSRYFVGSNPPPGQNNWPITPQYPSDYFNQRNENKCLPDDKPYSAASVGGLLSFGPF